MVEVKSGGQYKFKIWSANHTKILDATGTVRRDLPDRLLLWDTRRISHILEKDRIIEALEL